MSIYTFIHADHEKAKELMHKIEQLGTESVEERNSLFETLKKELILHAKSEEMAFYDPLKDFKSTKEDVEHGEEEHQDIEMLLDQLSDIQLEHTQWRKKFPELRELVEHHMREEESEIFQTPEK
ncbi:MAG: hemerythrin domain-containing protein [Limnobacter sp.]|nr:hemerythrin domain-containing protein [Limnobacter sp.]